MSILVKFLLRSRKSYIHRSSECVYFALDTSLDLLKDLSFYKGCYI